MILPLASGTIPLLAPGDRPVNWAVTGRLGGVSAGPFAELNLAEHVGDDSVSVQTNRHRVRELTGTGEVAFVRAVHGADFAWVQSSRNIPEADTILTDSADLAIAALGADCVLVGIAAADVIGVVHCGWRGLVAGVIPAAIAAARARTSAAITAILGPGICVDCFPVGLECADAVRAACPAAVTHPSHVDLRAGVTDLLGREGVEVQEHWMCTYESPLLFSHRRDDPTGRHGLLLWRGSARMGP